MYGDPGAIDGPLGPKILKTHQKMSDFELIFGIIATPAIH